MMNRVYVGEIFIILMFAIIGSIFAQYDQSSDFTFDGPVNYKNRDRSGAPITSSNSSVSGVSSDEMDIEAARKFNEILTIEDFINQVEDIPEDEFIGNTTIGSRFGGDERSNVEIPTRAKCAPEEQTVCLANSTRIFYFPDCTRVPRCGGCCTSEKLSCQPTKTRIRNFQVYASEMVNLKPTYKGKEILPVEEHVECKCDCKVKSEHCSEKQIYKPMECRCACANRDEETKCRKNNRVKQWDSTSCSCKCRGRTDCTTGSYYDHNTCSCKLVTTAGRRRYQPGEKDSDSPSYSFQRSDDSESDYSGQSRPIIYTINSDDPRRRHKEDPE